ncbi:MAG: hypothetical protein ACXVZ4_01365 [Gaiellaceae bacterium]
MTTPPQGERPTTTITMPARMPIPGNAEFLLLLVLEIVLAIVVAAADSVDAHDWVVATTWLGAAYLISRGVAKASRVLEQ